jgi:protein-S-isoprenylcysteine O-methyltransferase Ste14
MNTKPQLSQGDTEGDPRGSWTLVLVAIQFVCLGYLVFTGRLAAASPWLLGVELAALGLGAWSVVVMRPDRVNVAPVLRRNARLVTTGPYRLIRHPMYTSLVILSGAWLLDVYSPERLAVWVIFMANMVVKLTLEERYLRERFSRYEEYRRRTWRVIPFLY